MHLYQVLLFQEICFSSFFKQQALLSNCHHTETFITLVIDLSSLFYSFGLTLIFSFIHYEIDAETFFNAKALVSLLLFCVCEKVQALMQSIITEQLLLN